MINRKLNEYQIPVKIFYDKEERKIKIKINHEVDICNIDINKEKFRNLDTKIEEILLDEDKDLTLILGVDQSGNFLLYDTSSRQKNIYEIEIERKYIEKYKGDKIEIINLIKKKIEESYLEINSKLNIPVID